jgi:hypothetical protein
MMVYFKILCGRKNENIGMMVYFKFYVDRKKINYFWKTVGFPDVLFYFVK